MAERKLSLPDIPDAEKGRLPVLEAFHRKATEETVRAVAEIFDLKGDLQTEDGMYLVVDGPRRLVVYESTGTFWYLDTAKLDHESYEADLLTPAEAEKAASEFLRKTGWLPETFVIDAVTIGERELVEGPEKRERSSRQNHVCVNFRARYGEVETYGPGAKIKVFLGHKGEVIGVFRAAAETREYAHYPIVPREEVEKRLERRLGMPLEKLELTAAKLVYHAQSSVLATRFLQPVYLLELESEVKSGKSGEAVRVPVELKPFPATRFAPLAMIETDKPELKIARGEALKLRCGIEGGTEPFDIRWRSDFDDDLGRGPELDVKSLSVAHRQEKIMPHVITVTVTDRNGMTDTDTVRVNVERARKGEALPLRDKAEGPDPYVGVEWCNVYGSPGLPNISGTDGSAKGFKNGIAALPGWSSRFDWGNGAAWEQDFKRAGAPGGGTDTYWADNVHFAFFAGHGSSGRFWFGSTVDDHEMRAEDATWGDGLLNWIVLHACQTMRSNFEWDVWCDAFNGLHQMFGFHTNTQGSTPPLGSRFALWSRFRIFPWGDSLFTLREAWRIACQECFDSSREYSMIYAGQSGTDTANDYLPGYGFVSADPTAPYYWVYTKGSC